MQLEFIPDERIADSCCSGKARYVFPVDIAGAKAVVKMLGRGSSASLNPMASARATAVLPADMASIEPGTPLRIEPFCE